MTTTPTFTSYTVVVTSDTPCTVASLTEYNARWMFTQWQKSLGKTVRRVELFGRLATGELRSVDVCGESEQMRMFEDE
jgi:hypothetical protein